MRWTEDWTAVSVFTSLLISGPYQLRSSPVSGFFPVLRLDFQTLLASNDFYLFRSSLFFLGTRRATVAGDITGPNDASGAIWALLLRYVFFWFSSCFLLLANDFYLI